MSGVELGLAIIASVDLCLKYGKIFVSKYKSFRNAEDEIQDQATSIEAVWLRTSEQLTFLKRIWQTLSEDYQRVQGNILRTLERKLQNAVEKVSKIEKHNSSSTGLLDHRKAAKYALQMKEDLDKSVRDLEEWQSKFDLTWLLMTRINDQIIDTELTKRPGTGKLSTARHVRGILKADSDKGASPVFLPMDELASSSQSTITYSASKIVAIPGIGDFILDPVDCASSDEVTLAKAVRGLAIRLQKADPGFHLLKCHGVVRVKDRNTQKPLSYDFISWIPKDHHHPQSLRSHLLSQTKHSLTEKMSLAKQLAISVNYVHILDIVHKNIRPEAILIFESMGMQPRKKKLFLLGFRAFRNADSKTLRLGTSVWAEDIYQHPDRQGVTPGVDYIMQHDIYGLGVCLLEIGLWKSFVNNDGQVHPLVAKSYRQKSTFSENEMLKKQYVALAEEQLPLTMGEKYTRVVVNCLTCMDETNEDFGDVKEFEDSDGILIGVNYIEKIILQLDEILV